MDCRIVFCSAKKTAYCERTIKKLLSSSGIRLKGTSFSVDAGGLGEQLCAALKECRAVFVVGGRDLDIERNPAEILSRAISAERVDDCKRIKNNGGADGYYLKAGDSSLVLLPDDPKQIKEMLSDIKIIEAISAEGCAV